MNSAKAAMEKAFEPVVGMMTGLVGSFLLLFAIYIVVALSLRQAKAVRGLVHAASMTVAAPVGMFSLFSNLGHSGAAWGLLLVPVLVGIPMIVFSIKAPSIKGAVGERSVRQLLAETGFEAIHDVYLPSPKGFTQIDHVIRAGGALVALETKNYTGTIKADPSWFKWTQYVGRTGNRFLNPIKQNAVHVKALRTAVGGPIINLVAFVGDARFRGPMPDGVVLGSGLRQRLQEVAMDNPPTQEAQSRWVRLSAMAGTNRTRDVKRVHRETYELAAGTRSSRMRAAPSREKSARIEPTL